MKIKKGDTVRILYGKDSGKQGIVVATNPKSKKIVVDGINIFKKHVKGDGRTKTSEILTIVKPLDVSKVILICSSCGKPTRVGIKREGDKVERVCKKCNKVIEIIEKKKEEPKAEKKSTTKKSTAKKSTVKKTATKSKTVKK